jgi:hypothetical protein
MSKMDSVFVIAYDYMEITDIRIWVNFEFTVSIPFPIYLPQTIKTLLCAFLLLILIFGLHMRSKIFAYIQSPETKRISINILLWFDLIIIKIY